MSSGKTVVLVNRIVLIVFHFLLCLGALMETMWSETISHPNSMIFLWEWALSMMLVFSSKSYSAACVWVHFHLLIREQMKQWTHMQSANNFFCLYFVFWLFFFRKPVVEMKSGTPAKKKKHCNCKNSQCLKLWVL